MSRLEKHLGKGEPLKIGEDEFILKPLDVEYLPHFFKAMKSFSGAKEGASTAEMLANINDDGLNSIKIIINETLARSMPDEPEDLRKQFGLKYMSVLLGKVFEINSADTGTSDDKRKIQHLDKIKKAQQDAKSNK